MNFNIAKLFLFGISLVLAQFKLCAENEIQSVENLLNFVRSNYVATLILNEKELNEALITGLKSYLGEGFETDSKPLNQTASFFNSYKQVWLKNFLVLQFGVQPEATKSAEDYRNKLKNDINQNHLEGIILDVRGWKDLFHYEELAQFLSWWITPETILFGFKNAKESWYKANGGLVTDSLPLVILVNENTLGLGEVMAKVLRRNGRGIVIGTNSGGLMVRWLESKGGETIFYRVAHDKVFLTPDKALFPGRIRPDIEILVNKDEDQIKLEAERGSDTLSSYVFEQEGIKKDNEAALTQGEFSLSEREQKESSQEKMEQYDKVLQTAVDVLTAVKAWKKP